MTRFSRTLFPPQGRQMGLLAFAVALLFVTICAPIVGFASEFRGGFTVNTGADPIDHSMYVGAFRSKINSQINGDLNIASFTSTVSGKVTGDIHVLAGRTVLNGQVDGDVYVVSGNVEVNGSIGGDLVIGGGRVTLRDTASVKGDVVLGALITKNSAKVDGTVYGLSASLTQNGAVGEDMQVQTERLTVNDSATIGGELRYQSPTGANIEKADAISGGVTRTNDAPWTGVDSGAMKPFGSMMRLVWQFILGAVIVAIIPRVMYRLADHGATVIQPMILGLVGIVAIPVFAIMALVSMFGFPVGVLALLFTLVAAYLSQILAGLAIGRLILPRSWKDGSRGYLLLAMVLGMIIIGALRMAPVPFLGIVITAIVTIWGFGTALSIFMDLTSAQLRAAWRRP